jgi:hypothetical protein
MHTTALPGGGGKIKVLKSWIVSTFIIRIRVQMVSDFVDLAQY